MNENCIVGKIFIVEPLILPLLIYKHIVSILEPVIRILLSISEPQVKNILAYKKKDVIHLVSLTRHGVVVCEIIYL